MRNTSPSIRLSSSVSPAGSNDFNLVANYFLSIIQVIAGSGTAQHAPMDVTATWFVMSMFNNGTYIQIAYRSDNPAIQYTRTKVGNAAWTEWVLPYAAWSPGLQ